MSFGSTWTQQNKKQSSRGAWRNDVELFVTQQLKMTLMEFGIQSEDIMLLAAYALQADRINGLTVSASQGSDKRVVIYTMTSYARATDASGRQSLRGDIVTLQRHELNHLLLLLVTLTQ